MRGVQWTSSVLFQTVIFFIAMKCHQFALCSHPPEKRDAWCSLCYLECVSNSESGMYMMCTSRPSKAKSETCFNELREELAEGSLCSRVEPRTSRAAMSCNALGSLETPRLGALFWCLGLCSPNGLFAFHLCRKPWSKPWSHKGKHMPGIKII